jgi:hypothetical protein
MLGTMTLVTVGLILPSEAGYKVSTGQPPATQNYTVTEYTSGANNAGSIYQVQNGVGADIYDFCSQANCADGANPTSVIDSQWGWFGITANGGKYGNGAIFTLTPPLTSPGAWTENVIYSFCRSQNCVDGANPISSLWVDQAMIIGSTANQGTNGHGTIFEVNPVLGVIIFNELP